MCTIYDKLKNIEQWKKYYPLDDKYYLFDSNIIYSCSKIVDLYYQMCNARMGLHFYCDYEEYDMFGIDKVSVLVGKKYFLENALLYYNFSVDYLWQVLWLRYTNCDDISGLSTTEKYFREMKFCSFEGLRYGLTVLGERKLVGVLDNFFSDRNKLYGDLRQKYNALKHRAVFHTPGLGMNNRNSMFAISVSNEKEQDFSNIRGYTIPLVTREEVDLDKLKEWLIEFDNQFVDLCEYFFDIIIPKEYSLSEISIGEKKLYIFKDNYA